MDASSIQTSTACRDTGRAKCHGEPQSALSGLVAWGFSERMILDIGSRSRNHMTGSRSRHASWIMAE